MEVQLYQAFLTIEGKKVKLTKSIARQFQLHLRDWGRMRKIAHHEPFDSAICKVQAKLISRDLTGWLILVPNDESGLMWTRAVRAQEGGDKLKDIPTVIL